MQWLSRDLDEALFRFIDQAQAGDTLLGCFYEFRYLPVAERLKAAIDRGVAVKLILDAKINEHTDGKGKFHPSFPREDNKTMVKDAGLPATAIARWRENNPNNIQHNKFLVLLKGAAQKPAEVWTGSTNMSPGGIHGQTNVGHWVRNADVAAAFEAYWKTLENDPGAVEGETRAVSDAKRKAYRDAVMGLAPIPADWENIAKGVSSVFSPRSGSKVLDMYVDALDSSTDYGGITLAFGIGKKFKTALVDNTEAEMPQRPVIFLLLEKQDKPNPRASDPFVPLNAKHNVYQAWGSFLRDPVYQWTRETNARALGLNQHVAYVHSKFLLKDPLGADPSSFRFGEFFRSFDQRQRREYAADPRQRTRGRHLLHRVQPALQPLLFPLDPGGHGRPERWPSECLGRYQCKPLPGRERDPGVAEEIQARHAALEARAGVHQDGGCKDVVAFRNGQNILCDALQPKRRAHQAGGWGTQGKPHPMTALVFRGCALRACISG
ncbi:hypothetical protein AJ87_18095 [Rhizobium yanglingense]|nr:hypothetical protein AJ87_18095 [Rhizobium yanglingense]